MKEQPEENRKPTDRNSEAGIALATVLLLLLVVAAMIGATLLASSLNASSTGNYRTEAETLLVGDAGIQEAVNWFSSPEYVPVPIDQLSLLDLNASPITFNGKPVSLTSFPDKTVTASNYPTSIPALKDVVTNFTAKFGKPEVRSEGRLEGKYLVNAQLLSVRKVTFYDLVGPLTLPSPPGKEGTIERWLVQVQSSKEFNPNNQLAAIIELGTQPVFPVTLGADDKLEIKDCVQTNTIDSKGRNIPIASLTSSYLGGTLASVGSNGEFQIDGGKDKPVVINGAALFLPPNKPDVKGNVTINNGTTSAPTALTQPIKFGIQPDFTLMAPTKVDDPKGGVDIKPGTCGTVLGSLFKNIHVKDCPVDVSNGLSGSDLGNVHIEQGVLKVDAGDLTVKDLHVHKGASFIQTGGGNSSFGKIHVDDPGGFSGGGSVVIGPGNTTIEDIHLKGDKVDKDGFGLDTTMSINVGGTGKERIVIGKIHLDYSTLILGPGTYDIEEITVHKGSKLILSPGTVINSNKFKVSDDPGGPEGGDGASLVAVNGSGPVTLNVADKLEVKKGALFNATADGTALRPPSSFIVNVGTDEGKKGGSKKGEVKIEESIVSALISANPNVDKEEGKVEIKKSGIFIGSIVSDRIKVEGKKGDECSDVLADKHAYREVVFKTRFRVISWVKRNFN